MNCVQCSVETSKYTCPKCEVKTCSLDCYKKHKEERDCDGVRSTTPKFVPILGYSAFSERLSVEDQHFLSSVRLRVRAKNSLKKLKRARPSQPQCEAYQLLEKESNCENSEPEAKKPAIDADSSVCDITEQSSGTDKIASQPNQPTPAEAPPPFSYGRQCVLANARQRRIWLNLGDTNKSCGDTHYEKFSETLFWTVGVKFLHSNSSTTECESGELASDEEQTYTVNNIPESLSVYTLVRQFVKPRVVGPLISKSDLNMEKMAPFIEAATRDNGLMIYMKVPYCDKERYYVIDPSRPLLENLRNRFIDGYPTLIVTVSNQYDNFQILEEAEAREIYERLRPSMGNRGPEPNHERRFANPGYRPYNNNRGGRNFYNGNNKHMGGRNFHHNNNYNNYGRNGGNHFRNNNNGRGGYMNRQRPRVPDLECFLDDPKFNE